jgi:hypothetical protein
MQSVRYQLDQRHVAKNFNAESQLLKLPKLGALKLKWSRAVEGTPKMLPLAATSSTWLVKLRLLPCPQEGTLSG